MFSRKRLVLGVGALSLMFGAGLGAGSTLASSSAGVQLCYSKMQEVFYPSTGTCPPRMTALPPLATEAELQAVANGLAFTTATGLTGPTLSQAGTYFVVVEVFTGTGATPLFGTCAVLATVGGTVEGGVTGAVIQPPASEAGHSIAGMVVVSGPATLGVGCIDSSGNSVSPGTAQWWVSPLN